MSKNMSYQSDSIQHEVNNVNLNLVEDKIEMPYNCSIDITDILYKYQTLFKRIEVLRGLNGSIRLLLQKRNLLLSDSEKEAALFYLSIIDNEDYKVDFHIFCELPYQKISWNARSIMTQFLIYRDRVVKPLMLLYPDLNEYLKETELLLNQAINEIDRRITIIIPGKISTVKDDIYSFDNRLTLEKRKIYTK